MNGKHSDSNDDFDSQGGSRYGAAQHGAGQRDYEPGYPSRDPSRDPYGDPYSDPYRHPDSQADLRHPRHADDPHYSDREYVGREYSPGRRRWRTNGDRMRWPDQEAWELQRAREHRYDQQERGYGQPGRQARGYGYYRAAGQHGPDREYGLQGYGRGGYAEDYGSGRGAEMYQREWDEQLDLYGRTDSGSWGDRPDYELHSSQRQQADPRGGGHYASPLHDSFATGQGRQWGAYGGAGWSMASGEGIYTRGNLYRSSRSHRGVGPKGYVRTDERIKEDICERLTHDDDIDASEVAVECENGVVTLSGMVERRRIKHHVEDLVESVSGVKDIDNHLKVRHRWFHWSDDDSKSERQSADTAHDRHGGMLSSTPSASPSNHNNTRQ